MNLPTLFHTPRKGDTRQWRVWTEGDLIFTEHGAVGGKLQVTEGKRAEPKNVGKANATTGEEQAEMEARSMWQFKRDRKYTEDPAGVAEALLPMLAKAWDKKKSLAGWYLQPKLNGARCLATKVAGVVTLTSRSGKPYKANHIIEALEKIMPDDSTLDGEIYVHGMPLQKIMSLLKRPQRDSQLLEFHVYDYPEIEGDDTMTFKDRMWCLHSLLCCEDGPIKQVRTVEEHELTIGNSLKELEQEWIEAGYEGVIARDPKSKYQWNHRSSGLLKIKRFQDAEFKVIGFGDGRGKDSGKIVFTCQNDLNEKTFDVRPKASMEERAEMFQNGDSYIGKFYTVRFFDRTPDGLPFHPVGIVFRIEEDLPLDK